MISILGERGVVPPSAWTFYGQLTSYLSCSYSCTGSFVCFIDISILFSAARKYLLLPSFVDYFLSSGSCFQYREFMVLCRPRHRHSTDISPHSFRVCILAPSLCFAFPMDLFLFAQPVSTCFCLRLLMSPRRRLVHDFNVGRAWRCTALGNRNSTDISPHSFRVRILAPSLLFALSMVPLSG